VILNARASSPVAEAHAVRLPGARWPAGILFRTLQIVLVASAALATPATDEVHLEHTSPRGAATPTKTEAPALVLGGTFVILATVNGTTQAALRVDSGATDVMLPRYIAAKLISAGSLTHADYVTTRTYKLADGSDRRQKVYRLRFCKSARSSCTTSSARSATTIVGCSGRVFSARRGVGRWTTVATC